MWSQFAERKKNTFNIKYSLNIWKGKEVS